MWQLKTGRDNSAVEVPPQGARGPSLTLGSPAQSKSLEEKSLHPLAVKISGHSVRVRLKAAGNQGVFLKGPHTSSLAHKH